MLQGNIKKRDKHETWLFQRNNIQTHHSSGILTFRRVSALCKLETVEFFMRFLRNAKRTDVHSVAIT